MSVISQVLINSLAIAAVPLVRCKQYVNRELSFQLLSCEQPIGIVSITTTVLIYVIAHAAIESFTHFMSSADTVKSTPDYLSKFSWKTHTIEILVPRDIKYYMLITICSIAARHLIAGKPASVILNRGLFIGSITITFFQKAWGQTPIWDVLPNTLWLQSANADPILRRYLALIDTNLFLGMSMALPRLSTFTFVAYNLVFLTVHEGIKVYSQRIWHLHSDKATIIATVVSASLATTIAYCVIKKGSFSQMRWEELLALGILTPAMLSSFIFTKHCSSLFIKATLTRTKFITALLTGTAPDFPRFKTTMPFDTDYDLFGVNREVTKDDFMKARRIVLFDNHPDREGNEKMFKEMNAAADRILEHRGWK